MLFSRSLHALLAGIKALAVESQNKQGSKNKFENALQKKLWILNLDTSVCQDIDTLRPVIRVSKENSAD